MKLNIHDYFQIHSFKTNQGAPGVQTLNNTVSLPQVTPPRTQTIVYNPSSTNQFIQARLTAAPTVHNSRQVLRPVCNIFPSIFHHIQWM